MIVLNLMYGQSPGLTETFVTNITLKWPVLEMYVLVVTEVVLPPEGLATDVAGEGPLVCVGSLVDQEVVALGELPLAVLADVALFGATQTSSWS